MNQKIYEKNLVCTVSLSGDYTADFSASLIQAYKITVSSLPYSLPPPRAFQKWRFSRLHQHPRIYKLYCKLFRQCAKYFPFKLLGWTRYLAYNLGTMQESENEPKRTRGRLLYYSI